MAVREDIYDFIVRRGRPYALPGVWSVLTPGEMLFHPDPDPVALLAALQTAFPMSDLLASGVIQSADPEGVVLHPGLGNPQATLIALCQDKSKPFALMSDDQCLALTDWPLCASLEDGIIGGRITSDKNDLLISFSAPDYAILRSLGFAVAPSTGLGSFRRQQIDQFCAALHLPRRRSASASYWSSSGLPNPLVKQPISLTLVGWSVADLSRTEPSGLLQVQRHLADLHFHLGVPAHTVLRWQPSVEAIERIRHCLELGDGIDVQSALRDSFGQHRRRLIYVVPKAGPTLAELRREWLGLQQKNQSDPHERGKTWERLVQLQATQLIDPLVAQMQNAADPLQRNVGIALANTSDLVHRQSLSLLADCAKAAQQHNRMPGPLMGKDEFQQWTTSLDRVMSLTQMAQPFHNGARAPTHSSKPKISSSSSAAPKPKSPASDNKAS